MTDVWHRRRRCSCGSSAVLILAGSPLKGSINAHACKVCSTASISILDPPSHTAVLMQQHPWSRMIHLTRFPDGGVERERGGPLALPVESDGTLSQRLHLCLPDRISRHFRHRRHAPDDIRAARAVGLYALVQALLPSSSGAIWSVGMRILWFWRAKSHICVQANGTTRNQARGACSCGSHVQPKT